MRLRRILPIFALSLCACGPEQPPATLSYASVSFRALRGYERLPFRLAVQYRIPVGLAREIRDAAAEEGVDVGLAVRLVYVESRFQPDAVSSVGALGLTQLMLTTARSLEPGATPQDLLNPRTNLHLGFRYLHQLLVRYHGDVRLALLAYNRGPTRVSHLVRRGEDPANGYARRVLR